MIAYHFLQANMTSPKAPRTKWVEGQSRTLKGEIVPCERGYHASPSLWEALAYAPGPIACLVELSGEIVPHNGDKFAASTRKLIRAVNIERELRLFAADCAEHVLWIYERDYPTDDRPRKAIQAARDYAEGRIDAAAGDAAWDAAWVAARATARAAARAAAGVAARAAARAAAGVAERDWQRQQFEQRFGEIFAIPVRSASD